jgi:ATP-dependent helicase HrpB
VLRWDDQRQAVVAREISYLGEITLSEHQVPLQLTDPVAELILDKIRKHGLSLFGEQKNMDSLRARLATIQKADPDGEWPDVSEPALLNTLEDWLLVWLDKVDSLKKLKKIDLAAALLAWIGWHRQQQLNALLPISYLTPAGSHRQIDYDFIEQPVIRVPLQEMLGLSDSPTIANNKIPLVIHLLSPAARSIQITQDLAAFWAGAYREVSKEMRGRYPKHYWPENPASAKPTRFTKKHLSKKSK